MLDHDDFVLAALLEEGRIDRATLDDARAAAAARGLPTIALLVERAALTERDVALARAGICECCFVDLAAYTIDLANCERLPRSTAESLKALLLFDTEGTLTVGMVNPLDLPAVDQLRALLRADVETVLVEPDALARAIERCYALAGSRAARSANDEAPQQTPAQDSAAALTTGKEPIVAAVNQLLAAAAERGASDVHIGPDETQLHIRFRVDGTLVPQQGPGLAAHSGIIQRLKVMAALDLTQSRRPQDGKFRFVHNARNVDVRVSIIPTVCGENAVLRLLTTGASIKGFPELGMSPAMVKSVERLLDAPNGMFLVTGPTGSGKTTTLYTALKKLNSPDLNIMTIEDPVEVRLPLIRQIQANPEIGLTFAGALRSILRQDPDVVLVGEIRDEETARIAIQAALTGHLVLSSLHTNDAPGAIPRLTDLGCPAFAINAALLGVLAQRLVRRLCPDCARSDTPDPRLLERFHLPPNSAGFRAAPGCPKCASSGFKGRLGIYELFELTHHVRRAVEQGGAPESVRAAAHLGGYRPMWQDGLERAKLGLTTLAEVATAATLGDDTASSTSTHLTPALTTSTSRAA